MVDEVYAGDAPHYGGYKGASALSIGEILRIYNRLAREAINIVPVVATPSLRVS